MRDFSWDTAVALSIVMILSLPTGYVAGVADEDVSGVCNVDFSDDDGNGVFIENRGQYDPDILFVTSTDSGNIALCRDGIRHQIVLREQVKPDKWFDRHKSVVKDSCVVAISFEGGSPDTIVGEDRVDTIYNFFLGEYPSGWATNVPGYGSVLYRDVWDGIDIRYYHRDGKLKYDVILYPGAGPEDARMTVDGAESIQIEGGFLVISTPIGVYLSDSGLVVNYESGERIGSSFDLDGSTYGFDLQSYDASRTVVIDPEFNLNALNFSTYIGGSDSEYPTRMDVDTSGSIYLTGSTDSYDFPTTQGAYQTRLNGWENAYVFKLDKTGKSRIYATYIGGSSSDSGYDIQVDSSGNSFVVGSTYSEDFPTTTGAYNDTLFNASVDLFLLQLDSTGGSLQYSTYFGGSDSDGEVLGPSLDIDNKGMMYITSPTMSRDFPTTNDAFQNSFVSPVGSWLNDIVIVKFDLASMSLLYSTFLGGVDDDIPTSIVYDAGSVFVGGGTMSTDFNVTARPYQMKNAGDYDAFLLQFDMKYNSLAYSTYFGGSNTDAMLDFKLDTSWNSYCCGLTFSSDMPCSSGAADITLGGDVDGMLFGVDPTGSVLVFSTYLGYVGEEQLTALDMDEDLNIHVTGREDDWTYEDGFQFETMPGVLQEVAGGGYLESIYLKVRSDASAILYSTYIGGNDDDDGMDIRVDPKDGQPIVMGSTYSTDFPTKVGSYDTSHNGGSDIFVIKFDASARLPGAPEDPSAIIGDSFVEISWSTPLNNGGAPILRYSIYRGIDSGNLNQLLSEMNVLVYNDTTVTNGNIYYYGIRAINRVGEGMFSEEIEARPAAIPSAPRNLKVASLADKAVELTWTPPEYNGGKGILIDGYTLYRTAGGELDPTSIGIDGPLTHYLDEDVENGVNYSYYITASNEIGESPPSGIVYAIPMRLPTEPLDLRVERGDGFVHLFWSPPDDEGGSPILNYTITRVEKTTKVMTIGTVTDYNDTDVVNGNVYKYTVKARNLAGYGPVSEDITAKPLGHPSAPRAVTITVGPSSVTLSWEPPAIEGGAPIDEYRIYRGEAPTDLSRVNSVPGTEMTYTDTSLANGRIYYYYMTAVNVEGESVPSSMLNGRPLDRPGAPIDLKILPGDGFVQILWNDPISDGGSPIMGFTVLRGEYESVMEHLAIVPPGQVTYNDTTVKNGKTYYYQVKAYNVVGNGTSSLSVSGRPAGLPSPPDSIIVSAGDRIVDISWSKPADDGGLPISGVTIYRWTETSASERIFETTNNQGVYKDTTVQNGVTYFYALTATNEIGEGTRSLQYNATPIGKPSTVKDLVVKGSSSSSAELSWSAPESDGGSPILHYIIYRSAGTGSWIKVGEVGPDITTYTDKGLESGKIYRYRMTAVNAQGEGPQTDEQIVEIEEGASSILGFVLVAAIVVIVLIVAGVVLAFLLLGKKKEPAPMPPMGAPIQTPDQPQMAPAPVNVGIMPPVQQPPLPPAGYYQQDQSYLSPAPLPSAQEAPAAIQQPVSYPPEAQPPKMAQTPVVQAQVAPPMEPVDVPSELPISDSQIQ